MLPKTENVVRVVCLIAAAWAVCATGAFGLPYKPLPNIPPPPPPGPSPPPYVELPVNPVRQNGAGQPDPELRAGSGERMSTHGCTVCCYTMIVNYELQRNDVHVKNPDGSTGDVLQYAPEQLDQMLDSGFTKSDGTNVPGYQKVGKAELTNVGVLLAKLIEDIKQKTGVDFKKKIKVQAFTIVDPADPSYSYYVWQRLREGHPVIARVRGNTHSVLVTSSYWFSGLLPSDFDIRDPWLSDPNNPFSAKQWLSDYAQPGTPWVWDAELKTGDDTYPYQIPSPEYINGDIYDPAVNPEQYAQQDLVDLVCLPEPSCLVALVGGVAGMTLAVRRRRR